MEEIIQQAMFWDQVQTVFLCSALVLSSGLYISILPWKREQLLKSNRSFLKAFTTSRQGIMLGEALGTD